MPEPKTTDFPPQAALDWFKAKGIQPGFDYRDVWLEEQSNAFTVAKMLNADLWSRCGPWSSRRWSRGRPISSSPPPSSRCW